MCMKIVAIIARLPLMYPCVITSAAAIPDQNLSTFLVFSSLFLLADTLFLGSRFGAVLDMVTDRCATSCLMMNLAHLYPKSSVVFQFLLALDFSSHYIHMYSSLMTGATSHKNIDEGHNWFLRIYYSSRVR